MEKEPIIFFKGGYVGFIVLLLLVITLISGCTETDYSTLDKSTQKTLEAEIGKADTLEPEEISKQKYFRKNCQELGAYLCNPPKKCALDWLDSSDSYCCPIECNKCTEEQLSKCKSEDKCKRAVCNGAINFECEFVDIEPCANNGICESEEFSGAVSPTCPEEGAYVVTTAKIESSDCPNTCDDNDPNTGDWYDFDSQKCEHKTCVSDAEI